MIRSEDRRGNQTSPVLVWEATIFQPSLNFMVVLPTTFSLEVGKDADHQVSVLPWRRLFSGHIERLGPDPRQNL
jgi:hypothetical protein